MKNLTSAHYKSANEKGDLHNKVVYVTIIGKGEEVDRDWKVEANGDSYTVTDVASGKSVSLDLRNFHFEHNSLIKLDLAQGSETLQFIGQQHDLKFDFYY